MACPKCGSEDTRLTELGYLEDNYYCNNCSTSYTKTSKAVKGAVIGTVIGVALTPIVGPLGPIIGGMLGGGGDGGVS